MLKQLKLELSIKDKRTKLTDLINKQTDRDTRAQKLRDALSEATEQEDIDMLNRQTEELENEFGEIDFEAEISKIKDEIEDLENQLKEINDKPAATEEPAKEQKSERKAVYTGMTKRDIFFSLSPETRANLLAQDNIKSFLERVRELKNQNRAVKGAELSIPEEFLGFVRDNLDKYSKLVNKVNLKRVKGKARQGIAGTIPEGVWTEAIGKFNEAEINFNAVEVDGYKVSAYVPISNSTLEDSDMNLAAEILEILAQGIGLATDKAIVYGSGMRMPIGFVTRLAQTEKPSTWSADAPEWINLSESNVLKLDIGSEEGKTFFRKLIGALGIASPKYTVKGDVFWVMNRKTRLDIIGRALEFDSSAALVSKLNNEMPVIGGEIIELEFMADYDIAGGFGELYLLSEREGASLGSSKEALFLADQTVFAAHARYDGEPVIGGGFVIVNYNNINPTLTVVFAGDAANGDLVALKSLKVGENTLFPHAFDKDVLNYHCEITANAQNISAEKLKNEATVVIKNGDKVVNNGGQTTFAAGENILTVEVSNGNAVKRIYTVVVVNNTEA